MYNKECDLSRIKTGVPNRRMDRAARLRVNQGEAEGSVFAKATPGQGVHSPRSSRPSEDGATTKVAPSHPRGAAAVQIFTKNETTPNF